MAKYICSSSEKKTDHVRYWLEKNLAPNAQQFLAQSGYFSFAAIEPFISTLNSILKAGNSIRLVLGSNGGSLGTEDAKAIFKILKGKTNCSLTIIALGNAEFHPKCYVITRNDGSKTAMVGSQNFTFPGTAKNYEAGLILDTSDGDAPSIIDQISDSIDKWHTAQEVDGAFQIYTMKDLDDLKQSKIIGQGNVEVRIPSRNIKHGKRRLKKVVKKNVKSLWSQKAKPKPKGGKIPVIFNPVVLIAEIPKGRHAMEQANFDKDSFQNYFGFIIGRKKQFITLQHVTSAGVLGVKEKRPGVSVKSSNYRIELAAAKGLAYPTGNPPIAVFVRDTSTDFRYCLLMPNNQSHQVLASYLSTNLGNPQNRMRRITIDYLTLKQVWPNTPL